MRWLVKTKARRVWTGVVLTLCLLALVGWRLNQPKISHATLAQILAAVPPDLRATKPVDGTACKRMDRMSLLCNINWGPWPDEFYERATFSAHRLADAKQLWAKHQGTFSAIHQLLTEGPSGYRSNPASGVRPASVEEMFLIERLLHFGETFAEGGDFGEAQGALDLAFQLSSWFIHGGRTYFDYEWGLLLEGYRDGSLKTIACLSTCPSRLCQYWLDQLEPGGVGDTVLASVIRREFRDEDAVSLADSEKFTRDVISEQTYIASQSTPPRPYGGPLFGTLDPIATAEDLGRVVDLEVRNAMRPFSKYENSDLNDQRAKVDGLPSPAGADLHNASSLWTRIFKFRMNTTQNSIGRMFIANKLSIQQVGPSADTLNALLVSNSCVYRAEREEVRVLLATRLYRYDHNGHLPDTLAELVPKYLPALPIDPFDGNPLRYDAKKEVVYCLGRDLTDCHGHINGGSEVKGISLALAR